MMRKNIRVLNPAPARSDGNTFHVDFENFTEGLICARNAGVIFDYATRTKITTDFAFEGTRCAHIAVTKPEEATRLQILRAYDDPPALDNSVLEFVYRPVLDRPVTLRDWPVLKVFSPGGAPGPFELEFLNDPVYGADGVLEGLQKDVPQKVGIELRANGSASSGTWRLDVIDAEGRHNGVLKELNQDVWVRMTLHRKNGRVHLYAGEPGKERSLGPFADLLPGRELFCIRLGNSDEPDKKGSGYWDAFRLGRPLGKSGRVAKPEPPIRDVGAFVPQPPATGALGRERHLLIDDWSVAQTRNIQRTFHRPQKHPENPLIERDRPWEKSALYLFGGVERRKKGEYRMWYSASDPTPENRKNAHLCLAVSNDGVHWTKPALGLHTYQGSDDNNIVLKDQGVCMLFMNPDDPRPDFRYLISMRHQGTQGWSSPDGIRWKNHGVILPQSLDASSCHWDPVRRKYIASIKMGHKRRRYRGYAESDDFLRWTDTSLMMDVDYLDVPGDQIYQMQVFRYESYYLGLCKIYHTGTTDTCDTHLAVSHNCLHWERPYRATDAPRFATADKHLLEYQDPHTQPFLPTGPPGAWDFGNNDCPATVPVREGDELRFYYTGRYQSHSKKNPMVRNWKGPASVLGMARLRVDGFVSADADAGGGTIVTRPLLLKGDQLFVNVDASAGDFRTEVLDTSGKPVGGFAVGSARAIRSDRTRIACRWTHRQGLHSLAGKRVRLKFYLSRAALFSFWCE